MKNLTHNKIIKEIIENVRDDMQDEEIIHLVLEKPISSNKQELIKLLILVEVGILLLFLQYY